MPKTILVVDDNASNMRLFSDLLEGQDHRVVRAEYGMKGLRLARECRPNLILMDIQLPDVPGTELIQWIKSDKILKHIPIVAVVARRASRSLSMFGISWTSWIGSWTKVERLSRQLHEAAGPLRNATLAPYFQRFV